MSHEVDAAQTAPAESRKTPRFRFSRKYMVLYGIAAVLHLVFWAIFNYDTSPDSETYMEPAVGTFTAAVYGNQLSNASWHWYALRTPGYPLLLFFGYALTRSVEYTYVLVSMLQAFMAAGLSCIAWWFGARVSRTTALFSYLFTLGSTNILQYGITIHPDVPFALAFCLLVIMSIRLLEDGAWRFVVFTGVLMGVCILIRPTAKYYPILLVMVVLVHHKFSTSGWKKVGATVGLTGTIVVPWLLLNWVHMGRPVLDTIQGPAMLWSMGHLVEPSMAHAPEERLLAEHVVHTTPHAGLYPFYRGKDYSITHALQVSDAMTNIAQRVYRDKPTAVLAMWWRNASALLIEENGVHELYLRMLVRPAYKSVRTFGLRVVSSWDEKVMHLYLEVARASRVANKWLVLVGAVMLLWQRRFLATVLLGNILYVTALTALVSGYDRFRVPIQPLLCVLMAFPVAFVIDHAVGVIGALAQRRRTISQD